MDVVALVPGREHVCTRYRIAQYDRYLRAVGLRLVLETLAPTFMGRLAQACRRRRGQITLLVRKLLPTWQLQLLRRSSDALVYDFDDAVYRRSSFHRNGPNSFTRMLRFAATVASADLIFAGNESLAAEAARRGGKSRVQVMPTCIDASKYFVREHAESDLTRLVWIGSSSTVQYLKRSSRVLEAIGRAAPGAILRVVCDRFPRFRHLPVEPAPWSLEAEANYLAGSDIGVSVLPNDGWSQGKCGLKVLQYMAAGLPVLASPVGVNADMVPPGAGFLPRTVEEWVGRVRELSSSAGLRRDMGGFARSVAERDYHIDRWGPVLAERLREVACRV
jgi:glycosyltransferase involved in cell wall biosynthesis